MKKTVQIEKNTRFELAEGRPDLVYFVLNYNRINSDFYWIDGKRKIRELHSWIGKIIESWDKPEKKGKRVKGTSIV